MKSSSQRVPYGELASCPMCPIPTGRQRGKRRPYLGGAPRLRDQRDQQQQDVESSLRITRCKQMMESLPEHLLMVTKFLLGFLHTVSRESLVNKMSSSNLACVFGVNLVWPRHGSISLSDLTPINIFTEILIQHFVSVFGCPPAQVKP